MWPNCNPVSDLSKVHNIADIGVVEIDLEAIRKNRICIISGFIFFNYSVRTIRDTGGPNLCVASPAKMRLANGQLPSRGRPQEVCGRLTYDI